MPKGAIYVGRPTRWGNPWPIGKPGLDGEVMSTARAAVDRFESAIDQVPGLPTTDEIRRELAGKDLVCWCSLDSPCHADVLMKIANDAV